LCIGPEKTLDGHGHEERIPDGEAGDDVEQD
jgi:hypothetical protein